MTTNKWISLYLAQLLSLMLSTAPATAADLLNRQDQPWQPGAGAIQVPLWPEGPPAPSPFKGNEAYGNEDKQIAGRPFTMIEHVSRPTMSIFRAKDNGNSTGATVLVFPGGGYRRLAIDLEGTEVCDWLTAKGITCVVLKYRVPGSGPYWSEECNCRRIPATPYALQDAQRAMALLRARAPEWGIDPHRIGVLGFSAGGHMVADISNHDQRSYRPLDDADRQGSRPDFAIAVYPGHLWQGPGLKLNPAVKIARNAPPTLIVAASDDPVDDIRHSLVYYLALQRAKVPVAMHVYAHGGHAFGVRRTAAINTHWTDLAEQWMQSIGVLQPGVAVP
ncbi:alpha/beta hydrolase [Massilia forsythiae]|nr:alpha/beta hydrolase [Massilia forsythiae]